jgi:predicted nucleic acid-binding protein
MPSATRKIFIHSSVLTAFVDRGSRDHLKASKAIDDAAGIGCRLYTSSQVVSETYDALTPEVGTTVSLEFLQTILQSGIEILFPQKADLITAYRILKTNRNEKLSFNEALNATLMQKKGIDQVLTFGSWNKLFGTSKSNLVL